MGGREGELNRKKEKVVEIEYGEEVHERVREREREQQQKVRAHLPPLSLQRWYGCC